MKAKDSLYAQIQEGDRSETIPTTQNTMPSGETVTSTPIKMESKIVFQWDEIRNCNLDALAEQADKAAEAGLSVIMPRLFEMLGKTSVAAGTATDMAGAPLTFPNLYFLPPFRKLSYASEDSAASRSCRSWWSIPIPRRCSRVYLDGPRTSRRGGMR